MAAGILPAVFLLRANVYSHIMGPYVRIGGMTDVARKVRGTHVKNRLH